MSSDTYTAKWGIMATGGIAHQFSKNLLEDPSKRDTRGVAHEIVAVSSSSSVSRAEEFIKDINAPSTTKAYGSYQDLVNDPNVQIVYIATPHSHHFQNAMLAMEAGKHVLCEKSLTVTVAQTKKLFEEAKKRGLFFMEAVWTRFFPLSIKVRELIKAGTIGTVYRTYADFSFAEEASNGDLTFKDSHRMVNPDLAGGALLDLGVYSLTWVFQTLYHCQPEAEKETPQVFAAINKYRTGVDENTAIICQFPKHGTVGIATTSMRTSFDIDGKGTAGPAIRIQGSKGEIQVMGLACRPQAYRVILAEKPGEMEVVDCPVPSGSGMAWEADECARCLRDGKQESETMSWTESVAIMDVMDQALRQGGVQYPEALTTEVYDAKHPHNTGARA